MSLQPIQFGTLASSEQVNDNFEYLDGRITDTAATITTIEGNLQSQIQTVGNNSVSISMLKNIYPIGSIYISTNSTCPMATIISDSTWELVSSGKALWTGNGTNGGATISAGLPNATSNVYLNNFGANVSGANGAFTSSGSGTFAVGASYSTGATQTSFNAANSSSVFGQSSTVQPPAFVVNVWKRTA